MTWGDRLERGVMVCPVWDELQSERMRFNVRTRYRAHWGSDPLLVFHLAQAIRRSRPQGSDPVERLPAVEGSWVGDHGTEVKFGVERGAMNPGMGDISGFASFS